jgi:hypothetical protein
MHVAIVSYGCCKSRSWDVTYVASVSKACCKHLFKIFHLFPDVCCNRFQTYIAYVSVLCCSKCFHGASCKCFIWMLHMFSHTCCKCMFQIFHLFQMYVASILSGCCICCSGYTHMLQTYILIISPYFITLQQMLYVAIFAFLCLQSGQFDCLYHAGLMVSNWNQVD